MGYCNKHDAYNGNGICEHCEKGNTMTNAEFNQLLTDIMSKRGLKFRREAVELVAKLLNRSPGTINGWRYSMPIPDHMAYILKSKLKRG